MLIEAKVKVTRKVDGKYQKMTDTYILDREFFSHAEYTVTHLLEADLEEHGGTVFDFVMQSLRWSPIKEVMENTRAGSAFPFVMTLKDVFHDDDGNEKYLRYKVLLWANNLTQANQKAQQLAKEGYDMVVEGIKQVDYIYLGGQEIENE